MEEKNSIGQKYKGYTADELADFYKQFGHNQEKIKKQIAPRKRPRRRHTSVVAVSTRTTKQTAQHSPKRPRQ